MHTNLEENNILIIIHKALQHHMYYFVKGIYMNLNINQRKLLLYVEILVQLLLSSYGIFKQKGLMPYTYYILKQYEYTTKCSQLFLIILTLINQLYIRGMHALVLYQDCLDLIICIYMYEKLYVFVVIILIV